MFCGDALGAYFSEIDVIFACPIPGSDPFLCLQSMEKLQELKPEIVFYSHGSATRDAIKIIQSVIDVARQCQAAAFESLKANEDRKEVAHRIAEIMAGGSALAKAELFDWPYLVPLTVEGYRQYFKKNNII